MKKVLLFMSLSVSVMAKAQNIVIPDANFKDALITSFCVDSNGDNMADTDVDANNDNEIQLSEAQAITYLTLNSQGISNLSGIENFVNLTFLSCSANYILSLDVSALTNLRTLDCHNNQLTSLNILGCTQLQFLYTNTNNLTSLDLHLSPNLENVLCNANQLTSIDVHGLSNLAIFFCYVNQLTSLDLTGCTALTTIDCNTNQLETLNVEGCANLTAVRCGTNPLTSLYIKNGSIEVTTLFANCPNLSYICCDAGQITSVQNLATQNGLVNCVVNANCSLASNNELATSHELNVFPNPTDGLLNISTDQSINRLDIYDINGHLIQSQQINANQVDVKSLEYGVYLLRLYGTDGVYYSKFVKQ